LAFGSPIEKGKSTLDLPLGISQLIEMCFDDMMRNKELAFRGTDTVVLWRGSCACKNPRRLTHIYKHYWTIIRGSILFEDCGSEDNSLKDKSKYLLYLSKKIHRYKAADSMPSLVLIACSSIEKYISTLSIRHFSLRSTCKDLNILWFVVLQVLQSCKVSPPAGL
jgi:hypothetical protein